jgi:hypothetical protein
VAEDTNGPQQEASELPDDPCSAEHPDLVRCETLGPRYVYDSENAACKAACGNGAKAVNKVPSYNGPCVDQGGFHYRCQVGGRYCGHTASCCPCCEALTDTAVRRTRCRYN